MTLKQKILAIEQEAQERDKQRSSHYQQQLEKQNALMGKFAQLKDSVIRPAFTEARDTLLSGNHSAVIKEIPDGGYIALYFCRQIAKSNDELKSLPTANQVEFICDKERLQLQVIAAKTKPPQGGPLGKIEKVFEPQNLTRQVADDLLEAAIKAVLL